LLGAVLQQLRFKPGCIDEYSSPWQSPAESMLKACCKTRASGGWVVPGGDARFRVTTVVLVSAMAELMN
jgi:hypothetical protein